MLKILTRVYGKGSAIRPYVRTSAYIFRQCSNRESGIEKSVVTSKEFKNPFAQKTTTATENDHVESPALLSLNEKERRLKVLQLEVDIANQEGRRVPSLDFFNDEHWETVLTLPSKSARMKYYGFLWQVEMKKQAKQRKKEERAVATQERLDKLREERENNEHIIYGLGHVSMFLRIYDSTINHWMNHRYIIS